MVLELPHFGLLVLSLGVLELAPLVCGGGGWGCSYAGFVQLVVVEVVSVVEEVGGVRGAPGCPGV